MRAAADRAAHAGCARLADVPLRLLRLDLLPLRLVRARLGDDHRPLHRLGRGVAARHRRRAARDRRRDRLAVPPRARAAARSWRGSRRLPVLGQAAVLAFALMLTQRHGAGGRGTVHLLPVLMPDRSAPFACRRCGRATRRTVEQAAAAPPPPATPPAVAPAPAAPADRRRGGAAGRRRAAQRGSRAGRVGPRARRSALLLNAPGIHKTAYNQPDGWKRDVALAVTGPLADVSRALRLDRPRAARQGADRAVGRATRSTPRSPYPSRRPRRLDQPKPPTGSTRAEAHSAGEAQRRSRSRPTEAAALGRRRLARDHPRATRSCARPAQPRDRARRRRRRPRRDRARRDPTSSTGSRRSSSEVQGASPARRRARLRRQRRQGVHDRRPGGRPIGEFGDAAGGGSTAAASAA